MPPPTRAKAVATPAAIAASYNFPLPTNVATDPVALAEQVWYGRHHSVDERL